MSLEAWKSFFEWGSVVLIAGTVVFGAGALIVNSRIAAIQDERLRQFNRELTAAQTDLGRQQVLAADATAKAAEATSKAAEANTKVAEASAKVAGLELATADAKAEMAKQETRAANAERELLEMKERIKPRHLTDQQCAAFIKALRAVSNGKIKFGYTGGGSDEAFKFLHQLLPLFSAAGWEVPASNSEVNYHLEIQVTGIALMVPMAPGGDPTAPGQAPSQVQLNPTQAAIRNAFRAAGMDVDFQRWYPDRSEELVIGSKPDL